MLSPTMIAARLRAMEDKMDRLTGKEVSRAELVIGAYGYAPVSVRLTPTVAEPMPGAPVMVEGIERALDKADEAIAKWALTLPGSREAA